MGRKDAALAHFLNKPAIFADFCNGVLYGGRRVIQPEELEDVQKAYWEGEAGKGRNSQRTSKVRDSVKLLCKDGRYVIIAVENQDEFNLTMPLRCLEYDVLDYVRQLRRLKRKHKEAGDLASGSEYLSGIKKTDRLIPVSTILFYHGDKGWDSCRQLRDMLNLEGVEEPLRRLTANYRMHVVTLDDMDESMYETGLRELVGMMKRSKDKEKMKAYYQENAGRFSEIDEDTYDTICVMVNHRELSFWKESCRNRGKETINMCKALDDMMEESRMDGLKEGEREGERRGEKKGEKKGENRLAALINRLLSDGRSEDIKAAVSNAARRRRLYQEYGI